MAKKANTAKGAAKKARRNTKQSKAITESPKPPTVQHTASEPSQGPFTETDILILEAARLEVHSDLAELRDALLAVLRWSNALQMSFKQRASLPESVKWGAWAEEWKAEYRRWLQSIRDATDAVGRPSVAAIMDPNSHPHPALRWTARVRDSLNRLLASLHPTNEGMDGLGFIRAGANSLPTAFPWPLSTLRDLLSQLEAVDRKFTPAAKGADGAKSGAPECDDAEWKPAAHFPVKMHDRLRQAAGKNRKHKHVRKKVVDGTTLYSLSDARRWWGAELK